MACAIGFPAISVWDDWQGEICPSFAKRRPSPLRKEARGGGKSRHKLVFRAFQAHGGSFPITPATPSAARFETRS